ncbi:MAG: 2-amino-4-hydroxy-6-hydroxymethyldihydropteridine diphosphokinase [Fusobacteria bacterium]|nr:MAG: 2-amino-4-hydroxy-6-hydroxymethyldihydropteridine diphosphokinase [Fusobacteriota bacterium]
MKVNKVYLSLGSNIGNKYYHILGGIFAVSELKRTKVKNISSFYSTAPVGYLDQDEFLNCAIEIETELLPLELLRKLKEIEKRFKRERKIKWGPRTLDIDIILYSDLEIDTEDLILPHPRYKERNFVLIPLLDIVKNKNEIKSMIDYSDTSVKLEEKQNILVSTCLLGENTTYNGGNNYNYLIVKLLNKSFKLYETCPEVEGGLPTPRIPAERIGDKVIRKDGVDVTKEFEKGAELAIEKAIKNKVILALLKSKSPSCGKNRIYDGTFSKKLVFGNGITTDKLILQGFDTIEVNKDEQ